MKLYLTGITLLAALVTAIGGANSWAQAGATTSPLQQTAAVRLTGAGNAMILDATRAGKRLVALGDHGVVLLSDDDGGSFRQAQRVPTSATLTAAHFVDEHDGWAVGHWGTVLRTQDGGETWTLQRTDLAVDQPLFTVWFKDRLHGLAGGLWSLMLRTDDGGKTWTKLTMPTPPGSSKGDRNLYHIFANASGELFIAAEQGAVFRSSDAGQNWIALNTGNRGSFWSGIALDDGTILVGGIAGKIYRSADAGISWNAIESGSKSSITRLIQLPDKSVAGAALDGLSVVSEDRGQTFTARQRTDRLSLTAIVANSGGKAVLFSKAGAVQDEKK